MKAEMKGVARLLSSFILYSFIRGRGERDVGPIRVYRWRDGMGGSVAVNIGAPFNVKVDMF